MPALPDVPSVLRSRLTWGDSANPTVYNNLFFAYTGSEPDASDCSAIALTIANAFGSVKALWDEGTYLTGVEVTDLTSPSAGQGFTTASIQGTNGGEIIGGSTSLLVNYTLNRRYRGGKPRNYFPWGTSANLATKQSWSTDWLATVSEDLATVFGDIIGSEGGATTVSNHVNVSYYSGFTVVNPGGGKRARNVPNLRDTPQVDSITGRAPSVTPGSQRRRNRV
jgi:hypothetical protein